ncbi:hypothetical protein E2C01_011675 [Portunus trituberculatus]|uniref:Uncharacterized protein n=1 Tax=Portunus trituberculatus TaxID=210409 RepID=A0A5B7DBQ5_PORTR|nr:hypothetical protein [Portunus trituberculatus]
MTAAARVTTCRVGRGTPGSLCLKPCIFFSIISNFCVQVLKSLSIQTFKC